MKSKQSHKLFITFALATIFVILSAIPNTVEAQDRQLKHPTTSDKNKTNRVALVIGNSDYTNARKLSNPVNDATDMAQTLKSLGFEVLSGTNQTKREMENLIRDFGERLAKKGGVGLFFYAGHGLQVRGQNYLIPVEAEIPAEDEVEYAAVNLNFLLSKMDAAGNDLNIVILDACRNNPFARSWRNFRDIGDGKGLAKVTPPTGTIMLYATQPGNVASDGTGRNGLFTESLLKQIQKPNVEFDAMVKLLARDVSDKSDGKQLPWKEGIVLGDFYFVENGSDKNANLPKVVEQTQPNEQNTQIIETSRGKKSGKILYESFYSDWSSTEGKLNPLLEGPQGAELLGEFHNTIIAKLKDNSLTVATHSDIAFKDQAQMIGGLNTRFKDEKSLRFLPFALIFRTTFNNLRDLPEAYSLKVAVVSGNIDIIDTENGKTIASESFTDVRGFGKTQDQARRNALKAAAEGISEAFLNSVEKKSR